MEEELQKQIKVGLVSHLVRDTNLGCCALAVSNISIMDRVFSNLDIYPLYRVILAEPEDELNLEKYISLDGVTKFSFEAMTYPRPKRLIAHPSELKHSEAFKDLDLLIDLCGGDGYTDNYGLKRLIAESVPVIGARQNGVPVVFAPQTIGPFKSGVGKVVAKYVLGQLSGLYVRDGASYRCCEDLGLQKISHKVIDVAFALPYKPAAKSGSKIRVGLNVSGLLYCGGYNHNNYFGLSFDYASFINNLITRMIEHENVELVLVPHVINETDPVDDDYLISKELEAKYPGVQCAPRFTTASEAKSYISGLNFFIGSRMHSTIAAVSCGVPVVPVGYSRKFSGLFDTLEYPYYIDATGETTEAEAIDKIEHWFSYPSSLHEAIDHSAEIISSGLNRYEESFKSLINHVVSPQSHG